MTKKIPFIITGLVAASLALAGCGATDAEEPATTPDSTVSTPSDTTPSTPSEDDDVVEEPGSSDATGDATVAISSLAEGAVLEYPADSVVVLEADDPTKWSVLSTGGVTLETVPADNGAGYQIAIRVPAGSESIGIFNVDSGETITVTVTGS